jgi:hypothetical protein
MNKKIYAILIAITFTASAQAQFTFGVRGGFNLTNMSEKVDVGGMNVTANTKFKPGFQIGVVGEYAISDAFAVQPGILFATQGAKMEDDDFLGMGMKMKTTLNINYLQVPINAQYKLVLGDNMNLLLQAGPYFGFAVSGKIKTEVSFLGQSEKGNNKIDFGCADGEMRRLDFGLGFGVGLQFANIQVGVGYNLGLANLSNRDKTTTRNNGLALTLTYLFGK